MSIRAIVVGGTNGIGYGMACRVAAEVNSSTVIISGRTKPKNIPHANMEFRPLDATSMRQIKQYTDTFKTAPEQKLDLLIMTQGVMTTAGRTETPEGIDRRMALHYYGKQLLIRELLPVLKKDAKVVIVFDSVYGNPTKLDWDDLDLKKHFGLAKAANHCMVMNDAMVQYWAVEQEKQGTAKRCFIHAWPGAVNTSLARELPWYLRPLMNGLASVVGVSADTCAARLLNGVTQQATTGSQEGRFWSYINHKGQPVANKAVLPKEQLNKVAEHTWRLVDSASESSTA